MILSTLLLAAWLRIFVRNTIFSRVADYVPSSTRQGAESFLRAIRKTPEPFEYADDDLGSLPSIWKDYDDGQITLEQAVARSTAAVRSSVQVVDAAVSAQEVVPDVIENEQALSENSGRVQSLDPWPGHIENGDFVGPQTPGN